MAKVCSCCRNLLTGTYRRLAKKKGEEIYIQNFKHHLKFFGLISAAAAGCPLCKLLHETFSAQELQQLCAHEDWTIEDLDQQDHQLDPSEFFISYSFQEHNEVVFQFRMPSEPCLWRYIVFEQVYETTF
jgi:hypothetical protein